MPPQGRARSAGSARTIAASSSPQDEDRRDQKVPGKAPLRPASARAAGLAQPSQSPQKVSVPESRHASTPVLSRATTQAAQRALGMERLKALSLRPARGPPPAGFDAQSPPRSHSETALAPPAKAHAAGSGSSSNAALAIGGTRILTAAAAPPTAADANARGAAGRRRDSGPPGQQAATAPRSVGPVLASPRSKLPVWEGAPAAAAAPLAAPPLPAPSSSRLPQRPDTRAAPPAPPAPAPAPASHSLSENEFESFARDVAARIIQAYWRRHQEWRRQLQGAAEQRTLQQLLDGGLDSAPPSPPPADPLPAAGRLAPSPVGVSRPKPAPSMDSAPLRPSKPADAGGGDWPPPRPAGGVHAMLRKAATSAATVAAAVASTGHTVYTVLPAAAASDGGGQEAAAPLAASSALQVSSPAGKGGDDEPSASPTRTYARAHAVSGSAESFMQREEEAAAAAAAAAPPGGLVQELLARMAAGEEPHADDVSWLVRLMTKSRLLREGDGLGGDGDDGGGGAGEVEEEEGEMGCDGGDDDGQGGSWCSAGEGVASAGGSVSLEWTGHDDGGSGSGGGSPQGDAQQALGRTAGPAPPQQQQQHPREPIFSLSGAPAAVPDLDPRPAQAALVSPEKAPDAWINSRAAAAIAAFEAAAAAASSAPPPPAAVGPARALGPTAGGAASASAAPRRMSDPSGKPKVGQMVVVGRPVSARGPATGAGGPAPGLEHSPQPTARGREQALERLKRARSLPAAARSAAAASSSSGAAGAVLPADLHGMTERRASHRTVGGVTGQSVRPAAIAAPLLYSITAAEQRSGNGARAGAGGMFAGRASPQPGGWLQQAGQAPVRASLGVRSSQPLLPQLQPVPSAAAAPPPRPTTQPPAQRQPPPQPVPQSRGDRPRPGTSGGAVPPSSRPQAAAPPSRPQTAGGLSGQGSSTYYNEDELDAGDAEYRDSQDRGVTELPPMHVHCLPGGDPLSHSGGAAHPRYAANADEPLSPVPSPLRPSQPAAAAFASARGPPADLAPPLWGTDLVAQLPLGGGSPLASRRRVVSADGGQRRSSSSREDLGSMPLLEAARHSGPNSTRHQAAAASAAHPDHLLPHLHTASARLHEGGHPGSSMSHQPFHQLEDRASPGRAVPLPLARQAEDSHRAPPGLQLHAGGGGGVASSGTVRQWPPAGRDSCPSSPSESTAGASHRTLAAFDHAREYSGGIGGGRPHAREGLVVPLALQADGLRRSSSVYASGHSAAAAAARLSSGSGLEPLEGDPPSGSGRRRSRSWDGTPSSTPSADAVPLWRPTSGVGAAGGGPASRGMLSGVPPRLPMLGRPPSPSEAMSADTANLLHMARPSRGGVSGAGSPRRPLPPVLAHNGSSLVAVAAAAQYQHYAPSAAAAAVGGSIGWVEAGPSAFSVAGVAAAAALSSSSFPTTADVTAAAGEPLPSASLTAEKLTSIFNYLDSVEEQAELEAAAATHVALQQAAPPASLQRSRSASQAAAPTPAPGTRQSLARGSQHGALHSAHHAAYSQADEDRDDDTVSVASGGHRSAVLAESVYDGVRARIRHLQDDVLQRDQAIGALKKELQEQQRRLRDALLEADARAAEALAAQRHEYEATIARHLAFVDRLLADKDELGRAASAAAEQLKGSEERQERAIARLKEGWAVELRRQKEGWAAGERIKREQWQDARTQEIKDVTVKGLETEVHRLLSRHKAEVTAAQQGAADDAQRRVDAAAAHFEAGARTLKERLLKEQEDAVEKERVAGTARLREASERYEQQAQMQRMRLVADADLRLEQLEGARKEERRRYDDSVSRAAAEATDRQAVLTEDLKREKELLRKAHDKELDTLREQYETNQEGWRAAIAERARRELAEREAALRARLVQERNAEIEAVVQRLEAEAAAGRDAAREASRQREGALLAKHTGPLKEAKRAEAKFAEKFRQAGMAQQAAEEKMAAAEAQQTEMRRELESKSGTIRWLETQVSSAKQEAHQREADLRGLSSQREALVSEGVRGVVREKDALAEKLEQIMRDTEELRGRHRHEMEHVEARVKAAIGKKDEAIVSLREQLAAASQQLRNTEAVLAQQQLELGI